MSLRWSILGQMLGCAPKQIRCTTRQAGLVALALALALTPACHLRATRAPYAAGQAPSQDQLRHSLVPRLQTIEVVEAKVREGLRPAASLALVAQAPMRLYANVHFSGQEVFTLVFNERDYGFRSLRVGGLENGYYSGLTQPCVVRRLLGISLEPASVVALFLGGGPLLDATWQPRHQAWDGRMNAERLDFVDATGTEHMRVWYRWNSGAWFVIKVQHAIGRGENPQAQWEFAHDDLTLAHGHVVPTKSIIRNLLNSTSVALTYNSVHANPRLDQRPKSVEPDDWDETSGWEDEAGNEATGQESLSETAGHVEATVVAEANAKVLPRVFVPRGDGLRARGALCAE